MLEIPAQPQLMLAELGWPGGHVMARMMQRRKRRQADALTLVVLDDRKRDDRADGPHENASSQGGKQTWKHVVGRFS
jgi:hypothetical protein